MRQILVSLCLFILPFVSWGDVYRSTDAQGTVVLSDSPHSGSEKISSPKAQTYSPSETDSEQEGNSEMSALTDDTKISNKHEYQLIAILAPQQNETLRSATVSVSVDVKPALLSGDIIELQLDGQTKASNTNAHDFTIHNVDRGTHTLLARIVDTSGELIASSEQITIHVQLPHIMNKPVADSQNSTNNSINIRLTNKGQNSAVVISNG